MKTLLDQPILWHNPDYKKRILLIDIENQAHLIWAWETYNIDYALEIERPGHLISMAYKWLGEKKTHCLAQCDYKGYKPKSEDDSKLCQDIWELLDSADVIIGHNAQRFDIKKINYRFMVNGLEPTSTYKVIDTLLSLRRIAKAPSAKLNSLGKDMKLGRKLENEGWDLWKKCYLGDKDAWAKMKKYNIQDVILLEKWYLKLRPWITNHPNLNLVLGTLECCPKCGADRDSLIKKGHRYNQTTVVQMYWCKNCGSRVHGEMVKQLKPSFK